MLFTKLLCTICSNGITKRFCRPGPHASQRVVCEFSSKKSGNHNNKKPQKITNNAEDDIQNKIHHDLQKSFVQDGKSSTDLERNSARFEGNIPRSTQPNRSPVSKQNHNFDNKNVNQSMHNSGNHRSVKKTSSGNQGKVSCEKPTSTVPVNGANDLDDDDLSGSDSDDFELEELKTPNWKAMKLVKINNRFYKPSEITEGRSAQDITQFRLNSHTKCNPNVPKPIFKFDEVNNISGKIINEIKRQGFMECTPTQAQSVPLALSGGDVVCVSPSGSGKALAMIISAIVHITHQIPTNAANGPIAVILTSTPEVADHIRQATAELCNEANIKCSVLSGSAHQHKPNAPKTAIDLLIATPDALYQALHAKLLCLHRCSHLALYEADKIVDWALDEEVLQIASQIRPNCQKVVWSTVLWNHDLQLLLTELLGKYIRLDVGTSAVQTNISQTIEQIVKVSDNETKESTLNETIDAIESKAKDSRKTLVFTQTREAADEIADVLQKKSCKGESFHNGKLTDQRDLILAQFNRNEFEYLILTDVAAKNANFSRISNVISFDMPVSISDYVNRVNRTGRESNTNGTSYAIVTEEDGYLVDDLIAILRQSEQTIDPALLILKLANADSDDEIAFAIPKGKSFEGYRVDLSKK